MIDLLSVFKKKINLFKPQVISKHKVHLVVDSGGKFTPKLGKEYCDDFNRLIPLALIASHFSVSEETLVTVIKGRLARFTVHFVSSQQMIAIDEYELFIADYYNGGFSNVSLSENESIGRVNG